MNDKKNVRGIDWSKLLGSLLLSRRLGNDQRGVNGLDYWPWVFDFPQQGAESSVRDVLFDQTVLGYSWSSDLSAYEVERVFCEV